MKSLLVLCMLSVCPRVFEAERARYVIVWHSVNCTANPKYFTTSKCELDEPKHRSFNLEFVLAEDSGTNFTGRVGISVPRPVTGEFQLLYHWELDACKFLSGRSNSNKFLLLMYQSFVKYGNFPTGCPLKKSVSYVLKNCTVDMQSIPPYWPATNFTLDIDLYANGIKTMDVLLTGFLG